MQNLRFCKHKGCNSKHYHAKGYCRRHYRQYKKFGKTLNMTQYDFNKVVDKGDYIELILTNSRMEEVGRAKIDKEDLEKVQNVGRWSLTVKGYVYNSNSETWMHRVITGVNDGEDVDHIKTGKLSRSDNRKNNLRVATPTQNSHNQDIRINNTSGFKGVNFCKNTGKWIARIRINGKRKNLGRFDTPKEASLAYEKEAKETQGSFYRLREKEEKKAKRSSSPKVAASKEA